eukprot:4010199-Pyramimonas_sp.AAC.1
MRSVVQCSGSRFFFALARSHWCSRGPGAAKENPGANHAARFLEVVCAMSSHYISIGCGIPAAAVRPPPFPPRSVS